MDRIIILVIGTVLASLFILQLVRGKKYINAVNVLDSGEFPLRDLYVVGLVWGEGGLLRLKGKRAIDMQHQAALIYIPQYATYYANIVWAQAITFCHLILAVTALIAGIFYANRWFVIAIGIFVAIVITNGSINQLSMSVDKRKKECEAQLPEVVSTMAILLNSGMQLRDSWKLIADSRDGAIYNLMKDVTKDMNSGLSEKDAIYRFGTMSNSTDIRRFTSNMLQSMERSGKDLQAFLIQQSTELWQAKRQRLLQEGEQAATKLLLPIMLIFIGIMLIVMTAAFAGALF